MRLFFGGIETFLQIEPSALQAFLKLADEKRAASSADRATGLMTLEVGGACAAARAMDSGVEAAGLAENEQAAEHLACGHAQRWGVAHDLGALRGRERPERLSR